MTNAVKYAETKEKQAEKLYKENTILKITDSFSCNYMFISLPETDGQKTFVAGPYINFEITQKTIIDSATRYNIPQTLRNQIEKYYTTVPVYTDEDIIEV